MRTVAQNDYVSNFRCYFCNYWFRLFTTPPALLGDHDIRVYKFFITFPSTRLTIWYCIIITAIGLIQMFVLRKCKICNFNYWVMHPVARVSINNATNVGARFIEHFLHYMFRPLLVAIFRWFVIQKIQRLYCICQRIRRFSTYKGKCRSQVSFNNLRAIKYKM
jgi:hypothetical protein